MLGQKNHPLKSSFYIDSVSTDDDKGRTQEAHLASGLCRRHQESYYSLQNIKNDLVPVRLL